SGGGIGSLQVEREVVGRHLEVVSHTRLTLGGVGGRPGPLEGGRGVNGTGWLGGNLKLELPLPAAALGHDKAARLGLRPVGVNNLYEQLIKGPSIVQESMLSN